MENNEDYHYKLYKKFGYLMVQPLTEKMHKIIKQHYRFYQEELHKARLLYGWKCSKLSFMQQKQHNSTGGGRLNFDSELFYESSRQHIKIPDSIPVQSIYSI